MKTWIYIFSLCLFLFSGTTKLFSQTTLSAGDVCIVGFWADADGSSSNINDDAFAICPMVDLQAGTVIYITDLGWSQSTSSLYNNGVPPVGEYIITYVAPMRIYAGTVLYWYANSAYGTSSSGFSGAQSGSGFSSITDQILLYQGTSEASPTTFIFAVNFGSLTWATSGLITTNTSYLPPGLTNGVNALNFTTVTSLENYSYTGPTSGNMTTLRDNIKNFSNWTYVATGTNSGNTTRPPFPNSPLPVELTTFSASVNADRVTLKWETASEINNSGFQIERFQNSIWEKIGFICGSGNSHTPRSYSFVDIAGYGKTYSYRLKNIDVDGRFDYSNAINVSIKPPTDFSLGQNFPNPFNPVTTIDYLIPELSQVNLAVYDINGKQVALLVNEMKAGGEYQAVFDGSVFPSGIYFYILKTGNGLIFTKKLTLIK